MPGHIGTLCPPSVANLTKILLEYQKGRSVHEYDNVDKIIPQMSTKPGTQDLFKKKKRRTKYEVAYLQNHKAGAVVWQVPG